MQGKIFYFNESRGFGFIASEDKEKYFVHISNVDIEPGCYPKVGQNVSFNLTESPKEANAGKKEACDVQLLDS